MWELGDNPEAAKLLAIGPVEDLVALLEAASLCESKFVHAESKRRLVYNSMRLLLSCLEALRLSAHGLLASNTHIYCGLDDGCICPAFHNLTKYAVRYAEALTRAMFHKKRDGRNTWLLVFYSLCLQAYIRCALMNLEACLNHLQPSLVTVKYLAAAVDLFMQISTQEKGRLAKTIFDAQVKPSIYLREAGVEARGISSSWQEWPDIVDYVRRIFNVGIPINSSTASTTTIRDQNNHEEPSTSTLATPNHFNVGIQQPELKDDMISVVAPSITTFDDSLFSCESEPLSAATSRTMSPRNSWGGGAYPTNSWGCWPVEEDIADSAPAVAAHEFITSDALLAHIKPFLAAENGTPLSVSWQWGLPGFIRTEQSTEDLDLESEVVLVTSVDRRKQKTRRRFYALTWLELVEQQLGLHPEISPFLGKVTEQTATRLEEISDKGSSKLWPFTKSSVSCIAKTAPSLLLPIRRPMSNARSNSTELVIHTSEFQPTPGRTAVWRSSPGRRVLLPSFP